MPLSLALSPLPLSLALSPLPLPLPPARRWPTPLQQPRALPRGFLTVVAATTCVERARGRQPVSPTDAPSELCCSALLSHPVWARLRSAERTLVSCGRWTRKNARKECGRDLPRRPPRHMCCRHLCCGWTSRLRLERQPCGGGGASFSGGLSSGRFLLDVDRWVARRRPGVRNWGRPGFRSDLGDCWCHATAEGPKHLVFSRTVAAGRRVRSGARDARHAAQLRGGLNATPRCHPGAAEHTGLRRLRCFIPPWRKAAMEGLCRSAPPPKRVASRPSRDGRASAAHPGRPEARATNAPAVAA